MYLYYLILTVMYLTYFILLMSHLIELTNMIFLVFNSCHYTLTIDYYIFLAIYYFIHFIFIITLLILPFKFLFIPILNNSCHYIHMMKHVETIWILYFYMVFSLFILCIFSMMCSITLDFLHHFISYYFSLLTMPMCQYDLMTDSFSNNNIFMMNNNDASEEPPHPRTCIDPAMSHLPLGSLIEYAFINYDLMHKKAAMQTLKGKMIPECVLTYVNLLDWSRSDVLEHLQWWGYDTSYIYFKTISDQKIDYGLLYDIPVKTRNGVDCPSIPSFSPSSPSASTLSSFIVSDSSTNLPELSSSSLSDSFNNMYNNSSTKLQVKSSMSNSSLLPNNMLNTNSKLPKLSLPSDSAAIFNDTKLPKINSSLNSFSTFENNDVMKPFLKSSSIITSTCSAGASSSFESAPILSPFSTLLNSLDEKDYIMNSTTNMNIPSTLRASSESLDSIIALCSKCSNSLDSCSCLVSIISPTINSLSELPPFDDTPLFSPNTMRDLDSMCSPNTVSLMSSEFSSIISSDDNYSVPMNISSSTKDQQNSTNSSLLSNDADPLNLFNFSFDKL